MAKGTRLELTWVGKDQRPRLEPRILREDPARSHCATERRSPNDRFDNLLIHGDNLLALKALEHEYTGKVKCIFIDPPYNTGSAFAHYDDGIEHSLWLTMMRDRLEILRRLLREDGSIWVTVDDSESHYLKVLCDEIFGRDNFVSNVVWQKKYTVANDANGFPIVTITFSCSRRRRKSGDRIGSAEVRRWMSDIAIQTIIRVDHGKQLRYTRSAPGQRPRKHSHISSRTVWCGVRRLVLRHGFQPISYARWTNAMRSGSVQTD